MSEAQTNGEQYAELAKAVYATATRERWNSDKIFKMLNNPQDFIKFTEAVSINHVFLLNFKQQARA